MLAPAWCVLVTVRKFFTLEYSGKVLRSLSSTELRLLLGKLMSGLEEVVTTYDGRDSRLRTLFHGPGLLQQTITLPVQYQANKTKAPLRTRGIITRATIFS